MSDIQGRRVLLGVTGSIAAYDAFLRGWAHYRRRTPEEFAKAVRQFKRAVEFDPAYGRAHAALASTYLNSRTHRWTDRLGLSSWAEAMPAPARVVPAASATAEAPARKR